MWRSGLGNAHCIVKSSLRGRQGWRGAGMLDEQTASRTECALNFRLQASSTTNAAICEGTRYIQGGLLLSHAKTCPSSIASRASFGSSNFIHLCYSLLEFLVLAFLVAVSFILGSCQRPGHATRSGYLQHSYITLPRQIPLIDSAFVQWY